ncbi:MAG: glycoside hydrolase family 44 protein [Polyangiaceae bacterium]
MLSRLSTPSAVLLTLLSVHCGGGGNSATKSSNGNGPEGGLDSDGSSSGIASSSSGGGSVGSNGSSGGSDDGSSSGGCGGGSGSGSTAANGDSAGVTFSIDMSRGPLRQFQPPAKPVPISPYVYGINAFGIWEKTTKWGLARQGGDATTAWNWTNNYSNSGADYCFWEGQDTGGSTLAGNITSPQSGFPISTAQSLGVAYLVTAPIVDHVSAAFSNNTGIDNLCPGSATCNSGNENGLEVNSGKLDFASTDPNSPAFVGNSASKPGGNYCTCQPGATCTTGCAPSTTGTVYEDEFVNYLKVNYGSGGAPIFMMLDNEPNYWPSTHPEIWPYTGTLGCGTSGTVTFDDIVTRNTTYATAMKKAWPQTKIFGPVVAQDGIIYAGDYNDPNLPTPFTDYYLGKMATNSVTAGTPLLDAFDVHYYTSNGSTSQCVQVPRMFWDPNFTDFSASATDSIDYGWSGQNNYFDTNLYPRQMIPRLLGKIATAYGTKTAAPGLSFSEYNPGCETQIEGGVAEADLLGIFGREGVFAATAWPLKTITNGSSQLENFLVAAYDLYRNYDGKGSIVGDTTVAAATSDVEHTSVYAFAHSTDSTRVDLVAINKTNAPLPVTIDIASAPTLTGATLYELAAAKAGVVAVAVSPPTIACAACNCTLAYTLPAMSATTLVLQ